MFAVVADGAENRREHSSCLFFIELGEEVAEVPFVKDASYFG